MHKRTVLLLVIALPIVGVTACYPARTNDLVWAAKTGDLPRVKELLASKETHVNARNFDAGTTALIAAAYAGQQEMVEYLLANGADINLEDAGGTPTSWAAFGGHLQTYRYLRSRGGRLNGDKASLEHLLRILREDGQTELIAEVEATWAQEKGRR